VDPRTHRVADDSDALDDRREPLPNQRERYDGNQRNGIDDRGDDNGYTSNVRTDTTEAGVFGDTGPSSTKGVNIT